jgi:hypothetical protein
MEILKIYYQEDLPPPPTLSRRTQFIVYFISILQQYHFTFPIIPYTTHTTYEYYRTIAKKVVV